MQLRPPQSIDPNVPAIIPGEQQQNFKAFLDRVLDDVVGDGFTQHYPGRR